MTRPAALLADYRPGASFFLATPRHTMLAEGTALVLPGRPDDLAAYARAALDALATDGSAGLVVGAVPFAAGAAAHLTVPVTVRYAEPFAAAPLRSAVPVGHRDVDVRPVPDPVDYLRGVELALAQLDEGELRKVVLARSLRLTAGGPVDLSRVLHNLAHRDPGGYTFAVDLPGGRTLIGASPELLVSRFGDRVVVNPLAGTVARSTDPVEDTRRAAALRGSAKDLHEHEVVVGAVADALCPFLKDVQVPARPAAVATAGLWHLSSRISGELADPSATVLELVAALHPTPAVCGSPAETARAAIAAVEPFGRGFYTGTVGWMDATGDGEWAVTLRCAEVEDRVLRLFAGAGIVAGSRPQDELAETTAKFRTLLSAMGLAEEV